MTGTGTAATTASRMAATCCSSASRAEPAAFLHTFLAGHPMLMSMMSAPSSTLRRAASANCWGSLPTIWTERMPSRALWRRRSVDFLEASSFGSELSISDTAMPAPSPSTISRRGRSVTPAMGASTTGLASLSGPILSSGGQSVAAGGVNADVCRAGSCEDSSVTKIVRERQGRMMIPLDRPGMKPLCRIFVQRQLRQG